MTTTLDEPVTTGWEAPTGPMWLMRDTWTEAVRHLRIIPRNPDLIIFATIQPVMFVLLFVYVFGGSIEIPGFDARSRRSRDSKFQAPQKMPAGSTAHEAARGVAGFTTTGGPFAVTGRTPTRRSRSGLE